MLNFKYRYPTLHVDTENSLFGSMIEGVPIFRVDNGNGFIIYFDVYYFVRLCP